METIEVQIGAEDVTNQNVVDRKEAGEDVYDNDEAHIFLADEIVEIVELGVWGFRPVQLEQRRTDAIVVAVHTD